MEKTVIRVIAMVIIVLSLLYIALPTPPLLAPAQNTSNIAFKVQYGILCFFHGWMHIIFHPLIIMPFLLKIGFIAILIHADITVNVLLVITALSIFLFKDWARRLLIRYAFINSIIIVATLLQTTMLFKRYFPDPAEGIFKITVFLLLPLFLQIFIIKYFNKREVKSLFEVRFG